MVGKDIIFLGATRLAKAISFFGATRLANILSISGLHCRLITDYIWTLFHLILYSFTPSSHMTFRPSRPLEIWHGPLHTFVPAPFRSPYR